MNRLTLLGVLATVFLVGFLGRAIAQEMVEEPSTGKKFPAQVSFTYNDSTYNLTLTGVAVRKKFVFKVYGVAHYMETSAKMSKEEAKKAVLTDGKAKQIVMDFARGVGVGKIQGAYRESFKKNATEKELAEIQPLVDQFIGYFDKDVKENEQYVLRWLPGGVVVTIVQGEEKPAITNETFARVLWSIWLGDKSIVKRDQLIERLIAE
ncbi:MAG: hypothetical protein D6748_00870 [Calditrichaeota bacterium]|nr:MAG: hypothetical protein D6748_00870 [Calditrichota bacterium]